MRKILLVSVILLLVLSTVAMAQEAGTEKQGFWAKFISWFKPKPAEPAQPAEGQGDVAPAPEVEPAAQVTTETGEEATEQAGQAVRTIAKNTAIQKMATPVRGNVAPAPAVSPADTTIATDCYARECQVTICRITQQNRDVFCPQDINTCNQRYSNQCRTVSCDTTQGCIEMKNRCQKITPQTPTSAGSVQDITCEGTYDYCRSVYSNCQCGVPQTPPTPACTATSNRCKTVVSSSAVPTTSVEYVTCNDNYDNCVRQYGSCECGVPTGTVPAQNYTQPTVNISEQCCCRVVSATNANPDYKKMAKKDCSSCVADSYCPAITTTAPATATPVTAVAPAPQVAQATQVRQLTVQN